MGRFLLIAVLAAAVGGSVLTVGTQTTLGISAERAAEDQADVLAREIAQAGQSAAISAMLTGDGFRDPRASLGESQDYAGGRFHLEYTPGTTDQTATIRVSGSYGGAVHVVESTYAHEPMDAPGPLWLDVPYATATVSRGAELSGGPDGKPVQFDRRKHDELALDALVPLAGLRADLDVPIEAAGADVAIPASADWTRPGGLLDHLNVADANGLYTKAVGALDVARGDAHFVGDQIISRPARFRSSAADGIAFVDGDLTIAAHAQGNGVLVVKGELRVTPAGRLDWEGLVIVHSTEDALPVNFEGEVNVRGMVVVDHQAFAPGGHLDVSVYRDPSGMTADRPQGSLAQQARPWRPVHPFHQHTHAFDITPTATPRGDHVYFLERGAAGRHEHETQFKSLLDQVAGQRVYLEVANADNDGFARYGLDVRGTDGTEGLLEGTLGSGFGLFAQADAPLRTKPFVARDLRDLNIDVQSLRALRQSFDNAACGSWPICIGQTWDRHGAMALRVRRASDDARLYEATFYWHMRTDEVARHEAEEAAWRARIRAGEDFGTHLNIGADVDLAFDIRTIDALSDRLDFDGDRVRLISTRSAHAKAGEDASEIAPIGGTAPDESGDPNEKVVMCHWDGPPGSATSSPKHTHDVKRKDISKKLSGDYSLGNCPAGYSRSGGSGSGSGGSGSGGSGSGGSGSGSGGSGSVTVCLAGVTVQIPSGELSVYLGLGARSGACR